METEYSVDEVFDCLGKRFEYRRWKDVVNKINSEAVKMAAGSHISLLFVRERNAAMHLQYREVPFPWYV